MCRRTEFALGAVRDPRALERIRADLCQIRGVSVVDIDLRTGSIQIECEDDHATHAALDAAIRSLEEGPLAGPAPPTTSSSQHPTGTVVRSRLDTDPLPADPCGGHSTEGSRASMIEASGGGARERGETGVSSSAVKVWVAASLARARAAGMSPRVERAAIPGQLRSQTAAHRG